MSGAALPADDVHPPEQVPAVVLLLQIRLHRAAQFPQGPFEQGPVGRHRHAELRRFEAWCGTRLPPRRQLVH